MINSVNDKIRIRKGLPPRPDPGAFKDKERSADPVEKARNIAGWLREKKASDVMAFDLSGCCAVTEAMVIATAASVRHAQGLADHLLAMAGAGKLNMLGMEGYENGQWILVDLNDVLAHIFQAEIRRNINMEGLWSDAAPIELPDEE